MTYNVIRLLQEISRLVLDTKGLGHLFNTGTTQTVYDHMVDYMNLEELLESVDVYNAQDLHERLDRGY